MSEYSAEWRKYVLKEDEDKPESEQRSVEVKSLTLRDCLFLAHDASQIAKRINKQVPDEDLQEDIKNLGKGLLDSIGMLVVGSRNYVNFRGVDTPQTALDVLFSGNIYDGLWPTWADEVLAACEGDRSMSEEEVKN